MSIKNKFIYLIPALCIILQTYKIYGVQILDEFFITSLLILCCINKSKRNFLAFLLLSLGYCFYAYLNVNDIKVFRYSMGLFIYFFIFSNELKKIEFNKYKFEYGISIGLILITIILLVNLGLSKFYEISIFQSQENILGGSINIIASYIALFAFADMITKSNDVTKAILFLMPYLFYSYDSRLGYYIIIAILIYSLVNKNYKNILVLTVGCVLSGIILNADGILGNSINSTQKIAEINSFFDNQIVSKNFTERNKSRVIQYKALFDYIRENKPMSLVGYGPGASSYVMAIYIKPYLVNLDNTNVMPGKRVDTENSIVNKYRTTGLISLIIDYGIILCLLTFGYLLFLLIKSKSLNLKVYALLLLIFYASAQAFDYIFLTAFLIILLKKKNEDTIFSSRQLRACN